MEIKVIFFDAGRVLNDYDQKIFAAEMEKYSPFSKEEIYEIVVKGKPIKKLHEGLLKPKEFYRLNCRDLKLKNVSYQKFRKHWKKVIYFVNTDIEKVLKKIKPEIKLAVLSNANEMHWSITGRAGFMKKYFQSSRQRILSHLVRVRKPHGDIFKIALSRYNFPPKQILFIDDKERNLKIFRKLGGHTILYNCRSHSINYLMRELKKFDVISKRKYI